MNRKYHSLLSHNDQSTICIKQRDLYRLNSYTNYKYNLWCYSTRWYQQFISVFVTDYSACIRNEGISSYNKIASAYKGIVFLSIKIYLKGINCQYVIGTILRTNKYISKVLRHVNNDTKTVYRMRLNEENPKFKVIRDFLIRKYFGDTNNLK